MRDAQKNRVYKAEDKVRLDKKSESITFSDVTEVQEFLDDEMRPKLAHRDRRPNHPIEVRLQAKGKHCWYKNRPSGSFIDLLPGWGHTGLVLSHEYAHHLAQPVPAPSHGSDFVRYFVEVVETIYGATVADKLRASFDSGNVIWRPDDQVRAARNQVLRLRSDVGCGRGQRSCEFIPFTYIVWAKDDKDFNGETYQRALTPKVRVDSTFGDGLSMDDWGETTRVTWRQLRYVEAPMVRTR